MAPTPIASLSAATIPRVEPAHVPSRPSLVASVIVASIDLSPSSATKMTPKLRKSALSRDSQWIEGVERNHRRRVVPW